MTDSEAEYLQRELAMDELSVRNEKIDKLAREILLLSRNTLLVTLRFLDAALSQFEYVPQSMGTILTDGRHLYYNPRHVLQTYKMEKETITRNYLHVVMHCIFQHMYGAHNLKRDVWNLACDIAVEAAITELGLKAVSVRQERKQKIVLQSLRKEVGKLTAEKIYHYYLDKKTDEGEIARLGNEFIADDHAIWYVRRPGEFCRQIVK